MSCSQPVILHIFASSDTTCKLGIMVESIRGLPERGLASCLSINAREPTVAVVSALADNVTVSRSSAREALAQRLSSNSSLTMLETTALFGNCVSRNLAPSVHVNAAPPSRAESPTRACFLPSPGFSCCMPPGVVQVINRLSICHHHNYYPRFDIQHLLAPLVCFGQHNHPNYCPCRIHQSVFPPCSFDGATLRVLCNS
jgi:hypothetical protein